MIFQLIATLFLTVFGGILYRMGGAAKTGKWYDVLLNSKARDFGVPLCELLVIWVWAGFYPEFWWGYVLSFGASFGAMTTYWKKKGTDAKWYNWALTGLGYSIGFLPFALSSGDWTGFFIRAGVLTTAFTLWKTFQGNAVWSEIGAGVITVSSSLLLLIGIKKSNKK